MFFSTESKESFVHEQATTEFLIKSCEVNNQPAQIHIISEAKNKTKNKKQKTKKHKKQDQLPAAYLGHYVTQTASDI